MVTTLDVLSQGRAMLGIGAAWNEEESLGLALPFPPISERFERLEEAIQICLQMWSGSEQPYQGRHYQLARTLNSPQSLRRPHPPILIGGGGERKTLRLVARYAQSCNLFAGPELAHKLDVLRRHCEAEGRDYDEIEKTVSYRMDVGKQRRARRPDDRGAARSCRSWASTSPTASWPACTRSRRSRSSAARCCRPSPACDAAPLYGKATRT